MAILTDFYRLLDIPRDASPEQILEGYRRAAKRAHPDVGGSHEQFLRIGAAKRILSDPPDRRRYDAVLDLDAVIARPFDAPRLRDALRRAEVAVSGWRCPPEIGVEIAAVIEAAATRLAAGERTRQTAGANAGAGPRNGGAGHRDESGESFSDVMDDFRTTFRTMLWEQVCQAMQAWRAMASALERSRSEREARQHLYFAYHTYSTLRNAQRWFGNLHDARADDLRCFFHVSSALVDVADTLRTQSRKWDISYSFKPQAWLQSEVRRAEQAMASRGVARGRAPWADPSTRPAGGQEEPARQQPPQPPSGEPTPSAQSATATAPPPRTRRHLARNLAAAAAVAVVFVRCASGGGSDDLGFSASIKDTRVECSIEPSDGSNASSELAVACDLLDNKPGNGDRPYVEVWANGCERTRLDGQDIDTTVASSTLLTPCEEAITTVNWRVCQTRGGPLPDDCTWGSVEV